jgi:hypothetical protein
MRIVYVVALLTLRVPAEDPEPRKRLELEDLLSYEKF